MTPRRSETPEASASQQADVPSALYVECPECAEETLHKVLKGSLGTRGTYTLDATVQCRECKHVHHVTVREAKDVTIPIVVSRGGESERTTIELPGDDKVAVDDVLLADGRNVRITAVETPEGRRVESLPAQNVATLWGKDFDEVPLRFAVNMKHKTVSHERMVDPATEVTVGDEYTFGRLRAVVHAIKLEGRNIKHDGTYPAGEIVRVFAKPARVGRKQYRPPKDVREARRTQSREDTARHGRRRDYR